MILSRDTFKSHSNTMAVEFPPMTVSGARMYDYCQHLFDYGGEIGLPSSPANRHAHVLKIRVSASMVLRVVACPLLLALVILSFPWLGSLVKRQQLSLNSQKTNTYEISSFSLVDFSQLFHDLTNEGLLKMGDKGLIVSDNEDAAEKYSAMLSNNEITVVLSSDSTEQASIPDQSFDFSISENGRIDLVDRILKVGGIATIRLKNEMVPSFQKPSNYKIVYVRKYDSTFIAMEKTIKPEATLATHRRLFSITTEAKRAAALQKLEDVLLEPPRSFSRRSTTYMKRTKYLPDIMGDSLEKYPRRVFIDVGLPEKEGGSRTGWFQKHYPTQNLEFVMYKIETLTEESSEEKVMQIGMSDWLRKNVKEDEYVVMKAEAEVVEDMVKSKAIGLVKELFLECKPRGLGRKCNKAIRAYWECLALYGRLRDEGVAVHQWWG